MHAPFLRDSPGSSGSRPRAAEVRINAKGSPSAHQRLHGQLIKRKGQAQFAVMRMAWGTRAALAAVLKVQGFKTLIQTAFVERVNLTLRRGVAPLMRKTWAYA
jgi:hypothetical protein